MLDQIKENIEKMKELGLHHFKMETEAEGLTQAELVTRAGHMRRLNVPFWVKIGGCEAIGDIRVCRDIGAAGITAPMIESEFALNKFITAVEVLYCLQGHNRPELSINIETKKAVNDFTNLCRDRRIKLYTIGRSDLAGSILFPIGSKEMKGMINEVKTVLRKYPSPLSIGGGITPGNVNQVINDYRPNYINTRNWCFSNGNFVAPGPAKLAISLALKTEILLLKYFNQGNEARIKELEARLEK